MKLMQKSLMRTLAASAMIVTVAASMAAGAFAEGGEAVGYLPPQDEMIQGEIALHSGEQAVEEGTYGGYAAPLGPQIQGNVMLIGLDDTAAEQTEEKLPVAAGLTMKGLICKSVLFTARQEGQVITLAAPENNVTVRGTIGDLRAQMEQGAGTLSVVSNKNSTTLNLTLMCDGYDDGDRFVLRHIGERTILTIKGRSRRDLLIGR